MMNGWNKGVMMHERRFTGGIDRLRNPERVARLEIEHVVQLALEGLPAAKAVLDIGTGSGLFAEAFSSRGLQVTGVDANPEMLPAAQHFVPTGKFEEATAEKLPFNAGDFDLVFMGLVLHETDDARAALQETRRVANKRVAILEWPYADQPFGPPRSDRLSFEEIRDLAHQAGFINEVRKIRLENLVLYLIDL
jgi:ubiquinone/menaquinone biosynthesis C-methylase UbiE